ncbi:IclR family transcriptional regulator domain-containing protein [Mesorhizobium xinjiangense]|uniref:IclR family transcriptional regulator domain-containing protein n=1 Tax=Mesorhizobium xinjiangense TaxID=2678685 RepID=UPI0018DB859A|nr:IclR family transcriptional regulator C-terminal domain-containing protein [Mesorhizobium xinjiangense]
MVEALRHGFVAKEGFLTTNSENIAGLAKGLSIIEVFSTDRKPLTISAAARATNTTRASARRCLLTLLNLGYVVQVGSAFHPAPRLLRLGDAYFQNTSLPQLAQTHLDNARDRLRESVSLAVLDNYEPVFVARAEAEKIVSSLARIGRRLLGYCSATGRVLLADLPDEELDAYLAALEPKALTRHTITDKKKLREMILRARDERVAITDEELEDGMAAMAVPVVDHTGKTVAAMSVSASRARISAARMKSELLPVLREYAEALSRNF